VIAVVPIRIRWRTKETIRASIWRDSRFFLQNFPHHDAPHR
jgi:hypothetical protein